MKHLEIIANCTGDGISAISSCQKLAKAYGENIILKNLTNHENTNE
jgi:hypothetical protein